MDLAQLKTTTAAFAAQAFRPGTSDNHLHQVHSFIQFCDNHKLEFINPAPSTLCYYVTSLPTKFTSSKSVRNYASGVRFLHKQLGLALELLDSFPVSYLLRAADHTMRTRPLWCLPILPHFSPSCVSSPPAWVPGLPMKVCLIFGFLGMLRQSNLASPIATHFDPTRHTFKGESS